LINVYVAIVVDRLEYTMWLLYVV